MAWLCVALLLVQLLPFRYWRGTLGQLAPDDRGMAIGDLAAGDWAVADGTAGTARRFAAHVDRGASRLPFAMKCLPRAMVVCWLLRRARIACVLKIAARPASAWQTAPAANDNKLHAWVESGGATVIGALPGPWLVVLALHG